MMLETNNLPNSNADVNFKSTKNCKRLNLKQYKHHLKNKLLKTPKNDTFVSEVKTNTHKASLVNKDTLNTFRNLIDIIQKEIQLRERTCYFQEERAKIVAEQAKLAAEQEFKKNQEIYEKVIERCMNDINEAILSNKPKEEIQHLFNVAEIFINRFGHFKK